MKPRKASRVLSQLDQLTSGIELDLRQSEGRRLLSRRRSLLGDVDCKSPYESRKQIIERLDRAKTETRDCEERIRTSRSKSATLNVRLQDLLSLLQSKTRQFTGIEVQVEMPKSAPLVA